MIQFRKDLELRPYYTSDDVLIYHGEALETLRRLRGGQFSMVLTDPPYSSGGIHAHDRQATLRKKYKLTRAVRLLAGDNRDQRSQHFWLTLCLSETLRLARASAYLGVFTDWRQLPLTTDAFQAGGWIWRGIAVWDKTAGARAPHSGYIRHQCEYIPWATCGPVLKEGRPLPGAITEPVRQTDRHHPTGKPTPVLEWLLRRCPPRAWVLDPFMGSGTTLVAARRLGLQAVGIEMEEAYCEVAARRLEGAVARGV